MASPWPGKTLTPTASYCRLAAKRDHHILINSLSCIEMGENKMGDVTAPLKLNI